MRSNKVQVFSDGGARGNPGPSAAAFLVIDGSRVVYQESKFLGKRTNNFAEYTAVLQAIKWLKENDSLTKSKHVDFFIDSELVVKQLNGQYKIKSNNIKHLALSVLSIRKRIQKEINFIFVNRENNKLADALVNKKLDEIANASRI